jgi:uncharacterized RDD family membrane protein YckC
LTGGWGLYRCAYRTFDVDDMIANTVGLLAGCLLAPVCRFVPQRVTDRLLAGAACPTVPQRALATSVDLVLSGMLGVTRSAAPASAGCTLVFGLVVFVLVPALTGGATPGKWLVPLRIRTAGGGRPAWYQLLVRAAVLLLPWLLIHAGSVWLANRGSPPPGVVLAGLLLAFSYPVLPAAVVALRPDRRGLHDLAAGTHVTPATRRAAAASG